MKYEHIGWINALVASYCLLVASLAHAAPPDALATLTNYQVNSDSMLSSGQPEAEHFNALKTLGVRHVVDLIPGDRSAEQALVEDLGLSYTHIPVDWEAPTIEDFKRYVSAMQSNSQPGSKTLTHCKLNWRGATFTYLYRVVILNENEQIAREDMLKIWSPNDTWQAFINTVKSHYG